MCGLRADVDAVAIVVAFFLCWAPFHTQRLMTASIPDGYWTEPLLEIQSVLFFISGKPPLVCAASKSRRAPPPDADRTY